MTALNKSSSQQGEPISRAAIRESLGALGINPSDSCEVVWEPWGVTHTRYIEDERGKRIPDPHDNARALTVRTFYPIED